MSVAFQAGVRTTHLFPMAAIVPVKDRFALAELALASIINQELPVNEIVLVDDGSTIRADVALKSVLTSAEYKGIRVVTLRNDVSQGVSAARNRGARNSRSELLLFCDSDDFWHPQKTQILQGLFSRSSVEVLFHSFYWTAGRPFAVRLFRFGALVKLPRLLLFAFSFLNPSCFAIRRLAFGLGYDETLSHYEDLDLALRLAEAKRIWFYNFPLTFMGRSPGSSDGLTEQGEKMRQSAIEVLYKRRSGNLIYALAGVKILYHKIILCRFSRNKISKGRRFP